MTAGMAISMIGLFGLVFCIIWLIATAIKKKPKRNSLIGIGLTLAMFIGGGITGAQQTQPVTPTAAATSDEISSATIASSESTAVESNIKSNETANNVSSETDEYKNIDITSGKNYDAIHAISPSTKITESTEISTGIKKLAIEITTDKATLLDNTREFVHEMDSIRKKNAAQLIKADYQSLHFTHKIKGRSKDNYLLFMFDKKDDGYYVSDETEQMTNLTTTLDPDYAKAFSVALEDMK